MLQKIAQRNTQRLRLLSTTRRNRDTEPLHYLVCKPTDGVGIHLFGILREINAYHPHCLRHRMKQLVDEETEVLRTLWFPWHPHKEHPVLLTVHPLFDNPIASTALAAVSSSTYLQSTLRKVSLLPKCTIKSL